MHIVYDYGMILISVAYHCTVSYCSGLYRTVLYYVVCHLHAATSAALQVAETPFFSKPFIIPVAGLVIGGIMLGFKAQV